MYKVLNQLRKYYLHKIQDNINTTLKNTFGV